MSESAVQSFGPTSGVATGVLGLLFCAGASTTVLLDDVSITNVRVTLVLVAVAVVLWTFMLRPRVVIEPAGTLLLRNGFTDWRIPLATVKDVEVRAVMVVRTAGGDTHHGAAVGHSVRKIVRKGRPATGGGLFRTSGSDLPERKPRLTEQSVADFAADQVLAAAQRARDLGQADGPAVRIYAIPEIVAFAAASAAAVVAFLV